MSAAQHELIADLEEWIRQQKLWTWLDSLPDVTETMKDKVACWMEDDYVLIHDRNGKAWSTETLDGRKVKRRHSMASYLDN